MAEQISAKLLDFICQYLRNTPCNFYSLLGTEFWTLKFTFSSENAVAH